MLSTRRERWVDAATSLALTSFAYFFIDPLSRPFGDDTAVFFRYLENLKRGLWYTYDISERPLFLICSPLHALLTGSLAIGLPSVELAAVTANFLECLVFFYFLLRCFRFSYGSGLPAILAVPMLFLITQNVAKGLFSGLESPLLLATILAAIYAFVTESRCLYLAFVAITLSHVWAIPGVAVLFALDWFRSRNRFARPLAVGGLAMVLALAVVIGRSLYEGNERPFPLLVPLIQGNVRMFTLGISLLSLLASFVCGLRRRYFGVSVVAAGLSLAVFFVFFLFRSPATPLHYYVVFETVLYLGVLVLPGDLSAVWIRRGEDPKYRRLAALALSVLIAALVVAPRHRSTKVGLENHFRWLETVEGERRRVAEHAARLGSLSSTLLTSHGYGAYKFPGHVVDFSGRHSTKAVELELSLDRMIAELRAEVLIVEGIPDLTAQKGFNSHFEKCYANPRFYKATPFCLFRVGVVNGDLVKEVYESEPRPLPTVRQHYRFETRAPVISRFDVAIEKQVSPFWIRLTARDEMGKIIETRCAVPGTSRPKGKETKVCRWPLRVTGTPIQTVWVKSRRKFSTLAAFVAIPRWVERDELLSYVLR